MNSSLNIYKTIALTSFLALAAVQYILIYNTYELKNRQYNLEERRVIDKSYTTSITNDKVFPGGTPIIEHYLSRNMNFFEKLYQTDRKEFYKFSERVSDSLITELRQKSTMDSVFSQIVSKNKLSKDLSYLLTIESVGITFDGTKFINLFDKNYKLISPDIKNAPPGVIISGTLENPNLQNEITRLTVSMSYRHAYQVTFYLFADHDDRFFRVLSQMKFTFVLSLLVIFAVTVIYFITFRNWLRQKKLADMKSDFINSITHEFHTPISTIMVANKSLQNEKISSKKENIDNLTDVIERQTLRLQTLFDQVLDITKISGATLEKDEYDLNEILEEILLDYRLKLTDEKVTITFNKENNIPPVQLNRFWFTTMLNNIFNNAIKYNNKSCKEISVTTAKGKQGTEIRIKDNGIGISESHVKHIFEKFFRGNKSKMSSVAGLGLGLFYVKQCTDAHGWQISVSSEEGQGSEFTIYIQ